MPQLKNVIWEYIKNIFFPNIDSVACSARHLGYLIVHDKGRQGMFLMFIYFRCNYNPFTIPLLVWATVRHSVGERWVGALVLLTALLSLALHKKRWVFNNQILFYFNVRQCTSSLSAHLCARAFMRAQACVGSSDFSARMLSTSGCAYNRARWGRLILIPCLPPSFISHNANGSLLSPLGLFNSTWWG